MLSRHSAWLRPVAGFAAFFVLTLVLRASTFLYSALDWDESLYAISASTVLNGYWPYAAVWDNKPPLLHLFFALALWLVPDPVLALRLASAVGVSIGGWALYSLGAALTGDRRFGAISGGLFCVLTLGNGGLAANSELFFIPLTCLAMLQVWRASAGSAGTHRNGWRLAGAGALFALAIQVKYLAVFDLFAALSFWLFWRWRTDRSAVKGAVRGLALLLFPTVALAGATMLVFLASGLWKPYFETQIVANYLNSAGTPFDLGRVVVTWFDQLKTDAPVWMALVLLTRRYAAGRLSDGATMASQFCAIWLLCDIPAVFFTKLMWPHYFIQLYPALCLASAVYAAAAAGDWRRPARLEAAFLIVLLLVAPVRNRLIALAPETWRAARLAFAGRLQADDLPTTIARHVESNLQPGDYIYVVDHQPIVYLLTGGRVPTRYPFPPHIMGIHSSRMAGVDSVRELEHVLGLRPAFVIRKHERPEPTGTVDAFYASLDQRLQREYVVDAHFEGVDVYKRVAQ